MLLNVEDPLLMDPLGLFVRVMLSRSDGGASTQVFLIDFFENSPAVSEWRVLLQYLAELEDQVRLTVLHSELHITSWACLPSKSIGGMLARSNAALQLSLRQSAVKQFYHLALCAQIAKEGSRLLCRRRRGSLCPVAGTC